MYICSFLVSCVADNRNLNASYIFLNEKLTLLVPRTLGIVFYGFEISKFSEGACPQTPHRHWINAPFLIYSSVLYSNLLASSVFIETPAILLKPLLCYCPKGETATICFLFLIFSPEIICFFSLQTKHFFSLLNFCNNLYSG